MANRVALLEEGRIQQVGKPVGIYNSPANMFVAGFIGSPSMNLIPCQLFSDDYILGVRVTAEIESTVTNPRIAHTLKHLPRDVQSVLEARPDDILVNHEETAESANRADASNVEPLLMIGKDEPGANLILKTRTTSDLKINIGQTLRMTFASDRLHSFNQDTGLAIC